MRTDVVDEHPVDHCPAMGNILNRGTDTGPAAPCEGCRASESLTGQQRPKDTQSLDSKVDLLSSVGMFKE